MYPYRFDVSSSSDIVLECPDIIERPALNFGGCFAYEVAKEHGCPLLYVGKDFSRTDIEAVLG